MGLMDKVGAGLKNAGSHVDEAAEAAKYNDKIREQEKIKAESLKEVGEKIFAAYCENKKVTVGSDITDLLDKAVACDAEIAKLEKEKEEMKNKAHADREANRAAASEKKE